MIYFAYCRAFKHLGKGFKELFSCIIVTIVFIPLFIIDLLSNIFKKEKVI